MKIIFFINWFHNNLTYFILSRHAYKERLDGEEMIAASSAGIFNKIRHPWMIDRDNQIKIKCSSRYKEGNGGWKIWITGFKVERTGSGQMIIQKFRESPLGLESV